MNSREAADRVREWLQSEHLEARDVADQQAMIYSVTRVDEGQQMEMTEHSEGELGEWERWLHDTRIHLTQADLDWVLHVGKKNNGVPGPLQAFNLSRPIWLDGLTQNEFMHTMRHLWLTKLSLIHKIKFAYGPGIGKPGPVDDWITKKAQSSDGQPRAQPEVTEIDTDETGGFGRDFDPSEWV